METIAMIIMVIGLIGCIAIISVLVLIVAVDAFKNREWVIGMAFSFMFMLILGATLSGVLENM